MTGSTGPFHMLENRTICEWLLQSPIRSMPAGKNHCGRDTQLSKLAQEVALPEIEGAAYGLGSVLISQLTPGSDLS
jgi:hypothetical protein